MQQSLTPTPTLLPATGATSAASVHGAAVDPDAAAAEAADPRHGWEDEKERFMAGWADIAASYAWLHARSESKYDAASTRLTVPCIVLSTLTGTASFSLSGLFPGDADAQRLANYGIGGVQLLVGVLGTLSQYLKYAKRAEEHRRAAIDWRKLQRTLATTLALPSSNRKAFMEVLAVMSTELDRLEQAPSVPNELLAAFAARFGTLHDFVLPEAAGGLAHTHVYIKALPAAADAGAGTARTAGSAASQPAALPAGRRLTSLASAAALLATHTRLGTRVAQHLRSRAAREAVWREASVDDTDASPVPPPLQPVYPSTRAAAAAAAAATPPAAATTAAPAAATEVGTGVHASEEQPQDAAPTTAFAV